MSYGAPVALLVFGLLSLHQDIRGDSFVYSEGVFKVIAVPGAIPGNTYVTGINNSGQIVGYFYDSSGSHGFVENNGVFSMITVPGAPATPIFATGINDAGQIVGSFGYYPPQEFGFLDDHGVFTVIDSHRDETVPRGINNSGQIVGSMNYIIPRFYGTGFIYTNGVFAEVQYPGEPLTALTGMNDAGEVVGAYAGAFIAFKYQNGTFTKISYPESSSTYLSGINDSGEIIGSYRDSLQSHGLLYKDGIFNTFDFPGAAGTSLTGISNSGELVGLFEPTPTPEPASLLLFLLGMAAIGIFKYRHMRVNVRDG